MPRRVITFAGLGLVSGALATAGILPFPAANDLRLLVLFVLPGFVFGAVVGPALAYCGYLRRTRIAAWLIFATLGHFAAALCVTALTWRLQAALPLKEQQAILIAAALGGALGGGILAFANRLLVPGAGWSALTVVGGLLGPLVLLHDAGPILGRLAFYTVWQAGYAAALALTLPPVRRKQSAKRYS